MIFALPNIELSRLVWRTMCLDSHDRQYLTARYQKNRTAWTAAQPIPNLSTAYGMPSGFLRPTVSESICFVGPGRHPEIFFRKGSNSTRL